MKILFVTPAFNPPHGGFRVIHEVAGRLTRWHEVSIHSLKGDKCEWAPLPPRLQLQEQYDPSGFDALVICSPHGIDLAYRPDAPPRIFLFQQMMEDAFKPNDKAWQKQCEKFYRAPFTTITTGTWNVRELQKYKAEGVKIIPLGQGVNTDDFPLQYSGDKDGKTVLVEGWENNGNPAKDGHGVGRAVAGKLKAEGYNIVAYSARPLTTRPDWVNEYHYAPSLATLNSLYKRATILLKATRYDNRACAPLEAMTKGTPTVRAIIEGDEDLNETNSIRVGYDAEQLFAAAKKLLTDTALRDKLSRAGFDYIRRFSWDHWIEKYNEVFTGQQTSAKSVIVAVIYHEPEWAETKHSILSTGAPAIFVERSPKGTGSLAEVLNRGFVEACQRYPDFDYVWFVTNVTFDGGMLKRLESVLNAHPKMCAVHPAFKSDHPFTWTGDGKGVRDDVPFTEFTAPMVRRKVFSELGMLDARMPYWGHDLDFGWRARQNGWTLGVDKASPVGHAYNRHIKHKHKVTRQRAALRLSTDRRTDQVLVNKYGQDWKQKLGYGTY